jgi:hypothetical protein
MRAVITALPGAVATAAILDISEVVENSLLIRGQYTKQRTLESVE